MTSSPMWFEDLAEAATRKHCSYFHASSLRRGKSLRIDLVDALTAKGLLPYIVECSEVATTGTWERILPDATEMDSHSIVLLWAPEHLAIRRDFEALLAQSRPRGQSLLGQGVRIMIVSCRPRAWFPEPDGSSLIADAAKLRPRNVDAELIRRVERSLEGDAPQRIAAHSFGSVTLAQRFIEIELMEGASGNERRQAAGE